MNDKEYDALLSAASKKLGKSPEELKSSLEKGNVSALASGLSPQDKAKLREVLQNKELMAKLKSASSPLEIMKLLGNK